MPKGLAELGYELYVLRSRDQRIGLAPPRSGDKGLLRSGLVPCLLTVLRLAVHQKPDAGTGMGLAAALVRAGQLGRAVEVLRSGAGRSEPGEGLVRLMLMAAEAGDLDGARALVESLTDRSQRDSALVALIPAMARAGDRERAAALAETVRYPHNWQRAWVGLAEAVAEGGDFPAALGYVAKAAECADGGAQSGQVLLTSMKIAHAAGDHVLAGTFADCVEDLVRQESRYGAGQRAFLVAVLADLAAVSDPARARRLAARAVFLGGWAMVLEELEGIAPGGVLAVADEVMTWREAQRFTDTEAGRGPRVPGRRQIPGRP